MDILNEKIEGLVKKAEKSGMPYSILKKVYDRGMAAWKTGHRPGTTPQQWAFARVNSFVTKSSGTWGKADKDLADKVRGAKKEEIENPKKAKDIVGQVREKLGKDADAGDYVKDFRKSKAPQFKGKSDKKIQKMAIAAYLDSKEEVKEENCPKCDNDPCKCENIQESGHTDVASMKTQVQIAMDALQKMQMNLGKLTDEDDLPTWWTNKVATAVNKLDGMADYIDAMHDRGKEMSEQVNLEEGRMKELAGDIANVVMKMKKDRSMKGFADKFKKDAMKSMDIEKSLHKVLPDYIAGKDIAALMKEEVLQETEIEFDPQDFKQSRGPISNRDVADLVSLLNKEFPGIKGKKTGKYKIKFDHMDTSSIARAGGFSVNKLALALDGMGFSLSDKERSTKLRGIRGEYEPDNVDETLDKIREANIAKQKSMREILADIWNMNEGKSPFEKVEESPFDSKRQLKDPKKETMVMMKKGNYKGRVFVIDKKDLPKFERQGAVQVENKDIKEAPMKNYKYDPNFFVNDKKDTLQKLLRDRRSGYGETDLANYLAQKTGKDPEDVYFDDDELVYGSKTVMRGAHKQPIAKLMAKLKTIRNEYEPDMEEGFASDAQRRAAFASGYKEKGKKKKEEVEKDGKTATGQKPTKVEIEPEVK